MSSIMTGMVRDGGVSKSSGVTVLPEVAKVWRNVRDDFNDRIDWLLCSYVEGSKTDITIFGAGNGGIIKCLSSMPPGIVVFGGFKLGRRFVHFIYTEEASVMWKGRSTWHKNGVINVLEGCACELKVHRGMGEDEALSEMNKLIGTDVKEHSMTSPSENIGITADRGSKNSTATSKTIGGKNRGGVKIPDEKVISPSMSVYDQSPASIARNCRPGSKSISMKTVIKKPLSKSSRYQVSPSNAINESRDPFAPVSGGHADNRKPPQSYLDKPKKNIRTSSRTVRMYNGTSKVEVPYNELKDVKDSSMLPKGVDPKNRERSLCDEEFLTVFDGLTKLKFYALPAWKQKTLKASKGLF